MYQSADSPNSEKPSGLFVKNMLKNLLINGKKINKKVQYCQVKILVNCCSNLRSDWFFGSSVSKLSFLVDKLSLILLVIFLNHNFPNLAVNYLRFWLVEILTRYNRHLVSKCFLTSKNTPAKCRFTILRIVSI